MSHHITNFWKRKNFYFCTQNGAIYCEDQTTNKIIYLMDEPEGHRLLTILPKNHGLFVQDNDLIIVTNLDFPFVETSITNLPLSTKIIICIANEFFCVLASKTSENAPTDLYLWESNSFKELYRCYTTKLSVSALALQDNHLFIGTQRGELFLNNINRALPKISLGSPDHCYNYAIKALLPIEDSLLVKTSKGISRYSIPQKKHIDEQPHFEQVISLMQTPIDYSNGKLTLLQKGSVVVYDFSPSTSA